MIMNSIPHSISRSIGVIVVVCLPTLPLPVSSEAGVASMTPSFRRRAKKPWQEIVAAKRSAVDAKIPAEWKLDAHTISEAKAARRIAGDFIESLLGDDTRRITALDIPELADSITVAP